MENFVLPVLDQFPVDLVSLEDGCDEGSATAGPVLGQHEVEFVVDAHELADTRLHHVLEVGMVSEMTKIMLPW